MTDNKTNFVGVVPEYYEKYLVPLHFESYAADFVTRVNVPAGGQVLEMAAGTGVVTRKLRDKLDESINIIATDLNEPMLEQAQAKFNSDENITFQAADAMSLPFEDNQFDAVVCQFGLMFFPDRLESFKEVIRVLKPNGHYLFSVWDKLEYNELVHFVHEAINELFPDDPITFYETPFHLHRIDPIRDDVLSAGFKNLDVSVLQKLSKASSISQISKGMVIGNPIRFEIEEKDGPTVEEVAQHVEQALLAKFGDGEITGQRRAIVYNAHLT